MNDVIHPFRTWECRAGEHEHLQWSITSENGFIQGPLDLAFLRGKQMLLELAAGQVALLVRDGQLRAVFLEGAHHLAIGRGEGRISPEGRLVFLAADRPLELVWDDRRTLRPGEAAAGGADGTVTVRGRCACRLKAPSQFFDAFLRNSEDAGEPVVMRVLESLVLARLEAAIAGPGSGAAGSGESAAAGPSAAAIAAETLGRLTAETLGLELRPYGLDCESLALEVFPVGPATEQMAGQPEPERVNRG